MKKLRENLSVKVLSVVLCIAVGAATLLGGFYILQHWDSLFGRGYFDSSVYYQSLYSCRGDLLNYLDLMSGDTGNYNYMQRKQIESMEESLKAEATNFRFTVQDSQTGLLLLDNTGGLLLEDMDSTGATLFTNYSLYASPNISYYDEEGTSSITTEVMLAPALPDGTPLPPDVLVSCTTLVPLVYDDIFLAEYQSYEVGDPLFLWLTLVGAVVFLALIVFLCCLVGYKAGLEGIHLTWQDKIPYDLYLFIMFWLLFGATALLGSFGSLDYLLEWSELGWSVVICAGVVLIGLFLAAVLSTATRIKSRTIFRNTIIWRVCALIGRKFRETARTLPLAWRFALLFLGFLVVNAFLSLGLYRSFSSGFYLLLLVLFNGLAFGACCRWVAQWKHIRSGAALIVGGDPDAKIDTTKMYPDLKAHAEALNDLNTAISKAVDERMQSERFKAELITNVSHDLKTPLTSIINYVDLLKKEDIQDEKAKEYIEVLDRKSQRLKKLTEDLVEASKASTGTLTVNRERLGLSQLISQATAEYSERLAKTDLSIVLNLPEEDLYVWADGRHLWRILDNLLSNCCKYAMPGTRIYLDAEARGERAVVTMKNVSREPLNVPAAQLLERFVRGDASRSTEGSGLGLSIAQSLTELQGGSFSLTVDGDLFKAEVALPRAAALSRDAVL
ncbi:MAG: HAMP domain-containing histidine kinase [Oscillospiraceae bacterium]|nr:HAMP domain-containing histidine kinase [Oscillospiraceae bacterium]